jgi:hypothetical protein
LRTTVDASPLEDGAAKIKGSHGVQKCEDKYKGVYFSHQKTKSKGKVQARQVRDLLWQTLTE